jgi:hypothetical protein
MPKTERVVSLQGFAVWQQLMKRPTEDADLIVEPPLSGVMRLVIHATTATNERVELQMEIRQSLDELGHVRMGVR